MSRLFPLLLTFCTALASAQPFGLDDLSGGELFARFCASCHGESGHGNGPAPQPAVAGAAPLPPLAEEIQVADAVAEPGEADDEMLRALKDMGLGADGARIKLNRVEL